MDTVLPDGMRPAEHPLKRTRARINRLRLRAGAASIDVVEAWKDGFALARKGPQPRRGFVDLFDGARHLFHGLVYQTGETPDKTIYAFKVTRKAGLSQPLDFAADPTAPVALIPDKPVI